MLEGLFLLSLFLFEYRVWLSCHELLKFVFCLSDSLCWTKCCRQKDLALGRTLNTSFYKYIGRFQTAIIFKSCSRSNLFFSRCSKMNHANIIMHAGKHAQLTCLRSSERDSRRVPRTEAS